MRGWSLEAARGIVAHSLPAFSAGIGAVNGSLLTRAGGVAANDPGTRRREDKLRGSRDRAKAYKITGIGFLVVREYAISGIPENQGSFTCKNCDSLG
jgi:hypothetical protein